MCGSQHPWRCDAGQLRDPSSKQGEEDGNTGTHVSVSLPILQGEGTGVGVGQRRIAGAQLLPHTLTLSVCANLHNGSARKDMCGFLTDCRDEANRLPEGRCSGRVRVKHYRSLQRQRSAD